MNTLRNKSGFICDMDGVIYHGNRILPGVVEFIDWLQANDKGYLFLTNNSSRSVQHYVEKLGRLGLHVGEDKILTSGQAAAQYLKREYPGKRVFLLGNPSLLLGPRQFHFYGASGCLLYTSDAADEL